MTLLTQCSDAFDSLKAHFDSSGGQYYFLFLVALSLGEAFAALAQNSGAWNVMCPFVW